jgi:hypothetical protein
MEAQVATEQVGQRPDSVRIAVPLDEHEQATAGVSAPSGEAESTLDVERRSVTASRHGSP